MDKERKKPTYSIDQNNKKYCFDLLINYEKNELIKIYLDRLIFDGYIGYSKYKGSPSDIDVIRKRKGGFDFIEIKEKDLSKTPPKGFGMDVSRMKDVLLLHKISSFPYYYFVMKINNQTDRKKDGWYYISIDEFYKNTASSKTINGGAGMASVSFSHPTVVCDFEKFKKTS